MDPAPAPQPRRFFGATIPDLVNLGWSTLLSLLFIANCLHIDLGHVLGSIAGAVRP